MKTLNVEEIDQVHSGPGVLCFDYDGTLIGEITSNKELDELIRPLMALKKNGYAVAINTSRDFSAIWQDLTHQGLTFLPDYVIAQEGFVWASENRHCSQIENWNRERRLRLDLLFDESVDFFSRVKERILEKRCSLRWWERRGDPAGVRCSDISEMESFCHWLDLVLASLGHTDLSYQRNGHYMRFTHVSYTKGTALRWLMGLKGFAASNSFAIGDGDNDLSMLDATICSNLACPRNSSQNVVDRVTTNGGHVSTYGSTAGCIDSVEWFLKRIKLNKGTLKGS